MSGDEKFVSIGELISRINDERIRKEMWQRVDEIEKEKVNYERNYFVQYDGFKLHNSKFGGNAKGIKPPEFNAGMDRLLRSEIMETLADQKERELEKQGEQNLSPENKNAEKEIKEEPIKLSEEKYVSADDFQKLIDELATKKKQPFKMKKLAEPQKSNENIDPRRLAFREQMKAIKELNAKHKNKGLDKE